MFERPVDKTELYLADELFLAGTSVEILPIKRLDRYEFDVCSSNQITRSIHNQFFNFVNADSYDLKDNLLVSLK